MIPKTLQELNKMVKKKGMSIDIGIKRLSILKEKELISDEIFNDSKELLLKSEMEIFREKSSWFDEFLIKISHSY